MNKQTDEVSRQTARQPTAAVTRPSAGGCGGSTPDQESSHPLMSKPPDQVRRQVAKDYTAAVTQPSAGGCCGKARPPKGAVARLAGYSDEELAALPAEAVVNSFGCGNPVALGRRPQLQDSLPPPRFDA